MAKIFKSAVSVFLLLSLSLGVLDYYLQSCAELEQVEMSDLSDSDEEALKKEAFNKRFILESSHTSISFIISHSIISFWLTPSCPLEGHTGIVTPPPWLNFFQEKG